MARFTEKSIEALTCPEGKKDRLVFDDEVRGLAVRVLKGGQKSFLAQYTTAAGQRRRVPLGRWGSLTLAQARAAARKVMGEVAQTRDPAQERVEARAKAAAEEAENRLTLDVLLGEWETLALAKRRATYRREAIRAMRVGFAVHLNKPAAALTRPEVVKVLDGMTTRGKASIAPRTVAYGRACFNWALRRDRVRENPFSNLPVRTTGKSRDRTLSEAEVALIWTASGQLGWPFGPLYRVLLLTAQRRTEVGEMRWSELSADRATWTIPKERSKNGRAHVVHLAPAVRAILAGIMRVEEPRKRGQVKAVLSDLVFTMNGRTPVSGFTRPKNKLDALVAEARAQAAGEEKPMPAELLAEHALPPWRLHDFRRTAVTWMAEHGIPPHVADRILNHVTGAISGVAAVYQRGEFLVERRAALEAWAKQTTS